MSQSTTAPPPVQSRSHRSHFYLARPAYFRAGPSRTFAAGAFLRALAWADDQANHQQRPYAVVQVTARQHGRIHTPHTLAVRQPQPLVA